MSSYSVDLRQRIVLAVEGGLSKAQGARTFSVSLSSVKRYVNKAQRAEPLELRRRDQDPLRSWTRRRISFSKMTFKNAPTSPSKTAATI
jgi:transposase-like protein